MSKSSDGKIRVRQQGPGGFRWAQQRSAAGVVVHVAGELDLSNSGQFCQRLMKVVGSARAAVVVLDLSGLSFIDAHGVGVIVAAHTAARGRGRRLVVDGLHGTPAQVFGVLGLESLMTRRGSGDMPGRGVRCRYDRKYGVTARRRSVGGPVGAG